jgi:guanylate kinase
MTRGNLIIVSGPSGAGKSRIAAGVLSRMPDVRFSVSWTTREPRASERDGVDYHFVSPAEFERLVENGTFLEHAVVHGNFYGTSRDFIEASRHAGADVLLDVNVEGAQAILRRCPDAITVFILPPSYDVLRERLTRRQLDKDYVIEQRLRIASDETRKWADYEYVVVNDEVEKATGELQAIIVAARCRSLVRSAEAHEILTTFGGLNAQDSRRH